MAVRDNNRVSLQLRAADHRLSILVTCLQTAWLVKKDPAYLWLTKFFGKIFLINFAVSVITGIVQEFQFGMTWSAYSRFVGDVPGARLAMEALLAFFMESVFLGLWIFGWNKLSPRLHLATIWLAAIGTNLSAFFILAANSWMQHPAGYRPQRRNSHAGSSAPGRPAWRFTCPGTVRSRDPACPVAGPR